MNKNLTRLLLQYFEGGADLLVPVATRVLDLLPQLIVLHVDIWVVTRPLNVWNVQSHLALDVLHRPIYARRKLLCTDHTQ